MKHRFTIESPDEHRPDFVREGVQRQFDTAMADQLPVRQLPLTRGRVVESRGAELC